MTNRAYTAGRLAFLDGKTLVQNPYRSPRSKASWVEGYTQALTEKRAKGVQWQAMTPESAAVASRLAQWARENL